MPIPPSVLSSSSSSKNTQQEEEGSLWGKCMALLGQAATTLPIDVDKPLGANSFFFDGVSVNMNDATQLAALIQNISQSAMVSASPFVWHHDRRHAPSSSTVCKRSSPSNGIPHRNYHLKVGSILVQTPAASAQPTTTTTTTMFNVDQADGKTFPLYGFLQGGIGDADTQCICAVNHIEDLSKCTVQEDTCQSFWSSSYAAVIIQKNWTGCAILASTCTAGTPRFYQRSDAPKVLECLQYALHSSISASDKGVRCPELGPSDHWGLFPVGCTSLVHCFLYCFSFVNF